MAGWGVQVEVVVRVLLLLPERACSPVRWFTVGRALFLQLWGFPLLFLGLQVISSSVFLSNLSVSVYPKTDSPCQRKDVMRMGGRENESAKRQ